MPNYRFKDLTGQVFGLLTAVSHIFEGTNTDNHADMVAKGRHGQLKKTHCKYGHPFDEANALTAPGRRRCRLCMKMYAANAAAQKGASTR